MPMGQGDGLAVKPTADWKNIEDKTTIQIIVKSVCNYIKNNNDITIFNSL